MDRARKGYITKQDIKDLTKIDEKELKILFQGQKTNYDKLVSVIFDKEAQTSLLDNQPEGGVVFRKIDTLEKSVELKFSEMLQLLINIYKSEQFTKSQIKKKLSDYDIKDMYIEIKSMSDN